MSQAAMQFNTFPMTKTWWFAADWVVPKALDEILGLGSRGLRSVAILPLGYREEANDWLVNLKKVRRPREEFITDMI